MPTLQDKIDDLTALPSVIGAKQVPLREATNNQPEVMENDLGYGNLTEVQIEYVYDSPSGRRRGKQLLLVKDKGGAGEDAQWNPNPPRPLMQASPERPTHKTDSEYATLVTDYVANKNLGWDVKDVQAQVIDSKYDMVSVQYLDGSGEFARRKFRTWDEAGQIKAAPVKQTP